MEELVFASSLTDEEIAKNFENIDFFSGIMTGLEEALAFEKGSARMATIVRKRSLPETDSAELRRALNMTQKEFAHVLGVSPRTVESWEIGRSTPSPTAKNLLFLISKNHSLVSELI